MLRHPLALALCPKPADRGLLSRLWPVPAVLYALALALTAVSSEEFVNVAWDSAGVTTGPVTVPLVLAMGLGFGNATHAVEGFGILTMASICPIITVLLSGLWSRYRIGAHARAARTPITVNIETSEVAL